MSVVKDDLLGTCGRLTTKTWRLHHFWLRFCTMGMMRISSLMLLRAMIYDQRTYSGAFPPYLGTSSKAMPSKSAGKLATKSSSRPLEQWLGRRPDNAASENGWLEHSLRFYPSLSFGPEPSPDSPSVASVATEW